MDAPAPTTKRAAGRAGAGARKALRSALDRRGELPRLLYTREESARILGMSLSHFQRHVQPYIPCVYVGQLRQYRPGDLERWAESRACDPGRER